MKYLSETSPSKLRGTALVRLDFNTRDEWRMRAALPTLRLLLRRADKIVIVSHRGRPDGVKLKNGVPHGFEKERSLRQDQRHLQKLLGCRVVFLPHFRFPELKTVILNAPKGSIFLMENIRFLHGEETPRPELAERLASLADYYVNDAFAVDHHPADSVNLIEGFLPSYAGLELEQELKVLGEVVRKPRHPLILVVGGAKAHDKLGILKFFEKKADAFLLGGAAANTLLKLRGVDVKNSLTDDVGGDLKELKRFASHPKVLLPVDYATEKGAILDIGPKTAILYAQEIKAARTIIWAGPMGQIEKAKFAKGNLAVARAIAANRKAFSVTGGGETVSFLKRHKLDRKFSFISTGGGALLDFLAGKKLPGIAALEGEPRQRRATLGGEPRQRREALK